MVENLGLVSHFTAFSGWILLLLYSLKKESPNTYEDIYNVISNILEKKITKEHLTNYLKHSYKIYKS